MLRREWGSQRDDLVLGAELILGRSREVNLLKTGFFGGPGVMLLLIERAEGTASSLFRWGRSWFLIATI